MSSRKYTTINTLRGLYQYNRLVFGVPPATAICQRTTESILKDIPGVVVRVDDILVTGKSDTEHLQNLETVLNRLQMKGLKLQKSRVQFTLSEVEYNGFPISKNGVQPTIQKVGDTWCRATYKYFRITCIYWFGKLPPEFCTKMFRNKFSFVTY